MFQIDPASQLPNVRPIAWTTKTVTVGLRLSGSVRGT